MNAVFYNFFHSFVFVRFVRSFTQMEKRVLLHPLSPRAPLDNKIGSLKVNNSLEEKIFQLNKVFFQSSFFFNFLFNIL